jgi:hypothetical protein
VVDATSSFVIARFIRAIHDDFQKLSLAFSFFMDHPDKPGDDEWD